MGRNSGAALSFPLVSWCLTPSHQCSLYPVRVQDCWPCPGRGDEAVLLGLSPPSGHHLCPCNSQGRWVMWSVCEPGRVSVPPGKFAQEGRPAPRSRRQVSGEPPSPGQTPSRAGLCVTSLLPPACCSSGPSSCPVSQLPQKNPLRACPAERSHCGVSSAESLSLDGFWMEVERIQQRDELREEDGGGGEGRPPEGEECWQGLLGGGRPLWQGRRASSRHRPYVQGLYLFRAVAVASSLVSLVSLLPPRSLVILNEMTPLLRLGHSAHVYNCLFLARHCFRHQGYNREHKTVSPWS